MGLSMDRYMAMKGYSRALGKALNEKDAMTLRHCDRVVGLADELGRHCGLATAEIRHLQLAAALHDIGKIGIPDAVLLKPGKFDAEEWREMQSHSERGQRIVRAIDVDGAEEVALAIRHHHEDFSGDGYPDGLSGEAVPFMARMVAVVDSYDAMGEPRPYHPRRTHAQIMGVLEQERGGRFDPWLLDRFAEMIEGSGFRVTSRG
jgi:HD-GYP domain-containing protein (c-di-GMP phosphodiesterase class II)